MNMVTKLVGDHDILQVIAARALVINSDNKILMVSVDGDLWHLPGGWVEPLEPIKNACEREVAEETGLQIAANKAIYLYEMISKTVSSYGNIVHKLDVFFFCSIIGEQNINPEWRDVDNAIIAHREFCDETAWHESPRFQVPQHLRAMSFHDIAMLPACMEQIYRS